MAIYDNDGTANFEIGKLFDNDSLSNQQIGKVYDFDGTASHLIYSYGNPDGPYEWTTPDFTGDSTYGTLTGTNTRGKWEAFNRSIPYNQCYCSLYPGQYVQLDFPVGETHDVYKWQLEIHYSYYPNLKIEALTADDNWVEIGRANPSTGSTGTYNGKFDLNKPIKGVRITQDGKYTYMKAMQLWGY